jgi:ParB-like chromosome segregation protein Spo0J
VTDQPEIVYLPVTEIQENTWNPNVMPEAMMAALVENVKRAGFNRVLVVRPNEQEGRSYEIVDGEHSLRAARAAGIEFVPCVIRPFDDAEARAQTIAMNQIGGEMDPAQLAVIVREIDEAGIDLTAFSGFTADELGALDALLEIDWKPADDDQAAAKTSPQSDDERWVDLRVRVPYSVALLFRSELDRLKDVRETQHDHLAVELMVLNSAQTLPEEM